MKIVNPLYDKAFKYLMQNNKLAKKVIETILEEEIEELHLSQQETVVPDEKRQLTLFRLDFKALIKKPDGTKQKVLIELQKSKYITDIHRFRAYLGSNYLKPEIEKDPQGTEQKVSYPIITIYILGYLLDDVPYMAVTVNHQTINSVDKQPVELNSDFINQLNHKSHILQVKRLPEKRQNLLEKFLLLFNQAWISDQKYILDLQEIPQEFSDIASYLQQPVVDEEFRRQLEAEEEIDTIFDTQEAKYLRALAEKEKAEKEKEQAEKEKEQAEAREQAERAEKEQAQAKVADAIHKMHRTIRRMYEKNMPISEIAENMDISESEVREILGV